MSGGEKKISTRGNSPGETGAQSAKQINLYSSLISYPYLPTLLERTSGKLRVIAYPAGFLSSENTSGKIDHVFISNLIGQCMKIV